MIEVQTCASVHMCACVCVCVSCRTTSHHVTLCAKVQLKALQFTSGQASSQSKLKLSLWQMHIAHSSEGHPHEAPFLISFMQNSHKKRPHQCFSAHDAGEAAGQCLGADSCCVCMRWTWIKRKSLFAFIGWIRWQVSSSPTYEIREKVWGENKDARCILTPIHLAMAPLGELNWLLTTNKYVRNSGRRSDGRVKEDGEWKERRASLRLRGWWVDWIMKH